MIFRFPIALLACLVAGLGTVATADAANTWYAAPDKPSAGPCSQASPCSVNYALVGNAALAAGDTVVLAGGDYYMTVGALVSKRISIEGATSGPATRLIDVAAGSQTALAYTSSEELDAHLTDVESTSADDSSFGMHILSGAASHELVLDRVRAETTGNFGLGIYLFQAGTGSVVFRNSVGRAAGSNGRGIAVQGPSNGFSNVELRNVVADAPNAAAGNGLDVSGGAALTPPPCGNLTVTMKNSYVHSGAGPATDIKMFGHQFCSTSLLSFNSNWREATQGAYSQIVSVNDQHSSEPLFANAAAGDYHPLAGSPTIDAGIADDLIGPLDLDHNARVFGTKPDIGAYEFTPAATTDTVAPSGSALKFSPSSLVPGGGPASATKKKSRPKGTTVSYKLSEAATVTFTVQEQAKGRKQGKKCKIGRKKHSKAAKRCTIFKSVKGSFARAGIAGSNSFHFTGYLNGKKLKRGTYRMTGTPKDAAGNSGKVFTSSFSVRRR